MHPVLVKTFGGLSTQYYARQFIFGLIFPIIFIGLPAMSSHPTWPSFGMIVVLVINTLLYPYSRFVYESVINFIVGNNFFVVNALLMLLVKFITMALCWGLAIFIAPIGLLYLYIHHSRSA